MKMLRLLSLVAFCTMALIACQKELKFDESGKSVGVLTKDAGGDCIPVTVNGVYKVDTTLTADNFVDVKVTVTTPGTFDIKSDTINGYSFRKAGSVVFGANTIRLYASGKPLAPGLNFFTIKYNNSICTFSISVAGTSAGTAVYTLGGSPGSCTGATASGIYKTGTALTPNNTVTVQVNVTKLGTYGIGATTGNGFVFSGTGLFTTLGLQNVVLTGIGTPVNAGNTTVNVTNLAGVCSFTIPVLQGSGGTGGANYFQFTDGATTIVADPSDVKAIAVPNSGLVALNVTAFSVSGDSSFSLTVTTTGNPVTGVVYKTSNIGVPLALFNVVLAATGAQLYNADFSTPLQNIDIKFDVIDTVNKIVSGTFSGTAKKGTGTATITNGKFKATLL